MLNDSQFPTNNVFGEEHESDEEKGKGIVVQVEERGDVKSSLEKSCSADNSEILQDCLKISHDRGLPLINHFCHSHALGAKEVFLKF